MKLESSDFPGWNLLTEQEKAKITELHTREVSVTREIHELLDERSRISARLKAIDAEQHAIQLARGGIMRAAIDRTQGFKNDPDNVAAAIAANRQEQADHERELRESEERPPIDSDDE